jgi:hypothetical protein
MSGSLTKTSSCVAQNVGRTQSDAETADAFGHNRVRRHRHHGRNGSCRSVERLKYTVCPKVKLTGAGLNISSPQWGKKGQSMGQSTILDSQEPVFVWRVRLPS